MTWFGCFLINVSMFIVGLEVERLEWLLGGGFTLRRGRFPEGSR